MAAAAPDRYSNRMTDEQHSIETSVLIVGAGPYALSLAAHLRARGVAHQTIGRCMDAWTAHMPEAMVLKSEAFASDLFAPGKGYTLAEYCREQSLPYQPIGLPVQRSIFAAYGRAFQQRFVPSLIEEHVTRIERAAPGFRATTESGRIILAQRVVLAVGLHPFPSMPHPMQHLPAKLASHSFDYGDVSHFRDRRVMVWGAGASAINLAIDLKDHGAEVTVLARADHIVFHDAPIVRRPLLERVKNPRSALGLGWRSWLAAELPLVFHALPERLRHRVVARHLGPAPNWTTRPDFEGRIPALLGCQVDSMTERDGAVEILYRDASGAERVVRFDHVIAATGFQPRLDRLSFLDPQLAASIATESGSPRMGRNFESSVPGLFMVGLAAANSFGPLFRFACGAKFAARRLSAHLA